MSLRELAIEFATTHYKSAIIEDRSIWPEHLAKAAGAIKSSAEIIGIAAPDPDGFQVIAIEPHTRENDYLVCEMSAEGAEINLWTRYGKRDWENYGPKDEGNWD